MASAPPEKTLSIEDLLARENVSQREILETLGQYVAMRRDINPIEVIDLLANVNPGLEFLQEVRVYLNAGANALKNAKYDGAEKNYLRVITDYIDPREELLTGIIPN